MTAPRESHKIIIERIREDFERILRDYGDNEEVLSRIDQLLACAEPQKAPDNVEPMHYRLTSSDFDVLGGIELDLVCLLDLVNVVASYNADRSNSSRALSGTATLLQRSVEDLQDLHGRIWRRTRDKQKGQASQPQEVVEEAG